MKTHSITAYTFEEGDKLYYARDGEIKEIAIAKENLENKNLSKELRERYNDVLMKPLIDDIYFKPGEEVKQSENGRLILWKKRLVKEIESRRRRSKDGNLTMVYEEVETDLVVSTDLLDPNILMKQIVESSDFLKDVKLVTLHFKDTHRQIGAMSITDFLTLHPNDAANMLENQGIEAVAVKHDGTTENFDSVLKVRAKKRQ